MTKWKCEACGYEFNSDSDPDSCPGCGAAKTRLKKLED